MLLSTNVCSSCQIIMKKVVFFLHAGNFIPHDDTYSCASDRGNTVYIST